MQSAEISDLKLKSKFQGSCREFLEVENSFRTKAKEYRTLSFGKVSRHAEGDVRLRRKECKISTQRVRIWACPGFRTCIPLTLGKKRRGSGLESPTRLRRTLSNFPRRINTLPTTLTRTYKSTLCPNIPFEASRIKTSGSSEDQRSVPTSDSIGTDPTSGITRPTKLSQISPSRSTRHHTLQAKEHVSTRKHHSKRHDWTDGRGRRRRSHIQTLISERNAERPKTPTKSRDTPHQLCRSYPYDVWPQ